MSNKANGCHYFFLYGALAIMTFVTYISYRYLGASTLDMSEVFRGISLLVYFAVVGLLIKGLR